MSSICFSYLNFIHCYRFYNITNQARLLGKGRTRVKTFRYVVMIIFGSCFFFCALAEKQKLYENLSN